MNRIAIILLLISAGACCARAGAADRAQRGDSKTSPAALRQWIEQLDSDSFAKRREATQRLVEAGKDAVPLLIGAIDSDDAETASRAMVVLRSFCTSHNPRIQSATVEALKEVAAASSGQASRRVDELLSHHTAVKRQRAATRITQLHGTINYRRISDSTAVDVRIDRRWTGDDDDLRELSDLGDVVYLSLESAPVSNRAMRYVAELRGLQRLYLGQSRVTAEGLAPLRGLDQLEYLSLRGLRVGDEALASLAPLEGPAPLPALNSLGMDRTLVTDAGLAHLARFDQLRVVWLNETTITAAGLEHLGALTKLTNLYVDFTDLSGSGFVHLQGLEDLRYLSLKGAQLDDQAVREIAALPSVKLLKIDDTKITDQQLALLAPMKNVEILWLSKTPVTDAGLAHLKNLKSLNRLYLYGCTEVTQNGADELQKALPSCRIGR